MRITQRIMVDQVLSNIQNQASSLLHLQEQLATGRRIVTASDDPLDARRAMRARTQITSIDQYIENIAAARPRLQDTEASMTTVNDRILRLRELTLQAANGTNDQVALDNLAEEVNQILEDLVVMGNTESGDIYVFGGTRTQTAPFEVARDANGDVTAVTYAGNDERIQFAIGSNTDININEPGSAVFQDIQDIFQMAIGIRDDMLAGNKDSLGNQRLLELDSAREQISRSLARIGAVQNRLDRAEEDLRDVQVGMQEYLSNVQDADYAEVIVELNAQNNAFQAALSAGAQIIQPSLLNFLG